MSGGHARLSDREVEWTRLIATRGYRVDELAQRHNLSKSSVRTTLHLLYKKLEIKDMASLVAWYYTGGKASCKPRYELPSPAPEEFFFAGDRVSVPRYKLTGEVLGTYESYGKEMVSMINQHGERVAGVPKKMCKLVARMGSL